MHGDQRFAYSRPVRAGDALVCVSTVEEITSRGGHDFLTTRADVTTDAGEPVVSVWSRLVVRGETVSDASSARPLPPQTYRVTRADLVRYAGRLRRLQPDPLERPDGHRGGPARGHRPRHVHDGAGRPGGHQWAGDAGAVVEFSVRFTRPVVVPDDDQGTEVVVAGVVEVASTTAWPRST